MANLSHSAAATESAHKLNESMQFLLNFGDDSTQDSSGSEKKEMPPLKNSRSPTLKDSTKHKNILLT